MTIRGAHCLDVALGQLNALAPNRSKLSDGGLGDAAHAARESDHNPDANGVYHARDFTHDPAHGADMGLYPRRLIADPRATYVIFNNLFYDKVNGAIRVRPYPLVNPDGARRNTHASELHLSVAYGPLGDDGRQWEAFTISRPTPTPPVVTWQVLPSVGYGMRANAAVASLQRFLNAYGWSPALPLLPVTGNFLDETNAVVKSAQHQCGLYSDGIVGPQTKAAFWARGWRGR